MERWLQELEKAGYAAAWKYIDSKIFTGVPRSRVFVLFADSSVGGIDAVTWMLEQLESMLVAVSEEEPLVNNAITTAIDTVTDFGEHIHSASPITI